MQTPKYYNKNKIFTVPIRPNIKPEQAPDNPRIYFRGLPWVYSEIAFVLIWVCFLKFCVHLVFTLGLIGAYS